MEPKRLFRSNTNKVIGGVCGGLAEYFDMDPTLVRIIFVILAVCAGGGVLIYLILWLVTPEKPFNFSQNPNPNPMENQQNYSEPNHSQEHQQSGQPEKPVHHHDSHYRGNLIGGLVLITLGVIFLADEFLPHISFSDLWPIILVVIGIGLLINSVSGRKGKN
ncbi:MAG: PspC domain-containing protein [Bacteroidota bacterium]|nr:PspC domain-containing protein [Bacteroidota bacterium]